MPACAHLGNQACLNLSNEQVYFWAARQCRLHHTCSFDAPAGEKRSYLRFGSTPAS